MTLAGTLPGIDFTDLDNFANGFPHHRLMHDDSLHRQKPGANSPGKTSPALPSTRSVKAPEFSGGSGPT